MDAGTRRRAGAPRAALTVYQNFLSTLISFLELLAVGLMTWSVIFLVDMAYRRGYDTDGLRLTGSGSPYFYRADFNWTALVSWLAGVAVGLLFTVTPWFTGPLARGIFAQSSLGYFIGGAVSVVLYLALLYGRSRAESKPVRHLERKTA